MIKRQASPEKVTDPPPAGRARRRHNLMVPIRDGVELALDVLLPAGEGPFPTVLIRTCDKNRHIDTPRPVLQALLGAGYAIAAQDVRGRFNSDGRWGMYFAEFDDGFDTLEWLAGQAWCDGNIGMYGVSCEASVQWFAARSGSEHLKAIVPMAATPSSMWNNGAPPRRGIPGAEGAVCGRHGVSLFPEYRLRQHAMGRGPAIVDAICRHSRSPGLAKHMDRRDAAAPHAGRVLGAWRLQLLGSDPHFRGRPLLIRSLLSTPATWWLEVSRNAKQTTSPRRCSKPLSPSMEPRTQSGPWVFTEVFLRPVSHAGNRNRDT
ncbi:CocE/NonD family hydrolase [Paenarthrobacter sp. C1]|uniref:CocE/NonD family hydrolase n=1 Tax=Paenarthrobacter sp. C1 TaxID=3400220 RepID=UPI003BF593AB